MLFLPPKKDKRGIIGILLFFLILFTIVIIGFALAVTTGVASYATDIIVPELNAISTSVGNNVNDTEVTSAINSTVNIVDSFIAAIPWLLTFAYGLALVFSIIFVVSYRTNPHPTFIGFYVAMILLLIFGAILISNAYEDIYTGTDAIALQLQSQTAMSYLILYSPAILTLIAFIAGVYVFASPKEGGFNV